MTIHLGSIHFHFCDADEVPCRKTLISRAKYTPRRPPPLHWTLGLNL